MGESLSALGFFRVGVVTPELRVADIDFNKKQIISAIDAGIEKNCHFLLFPELCITGYTCGDLFFQRTLLENSKQAIDEIRLHTYDTKSTAVIGAPLAVDGKLFNCAFFISSGEIIAIIPKTYLPNSSVYYEERWFSSEFERICDTIPWQNETVPFGADILFQVVNNPLCLIGIELCEDLWSLKPPSFDMAAAGANVLLNLSASDEILGKARYRRQLVESQSARCYAAYLYSSSGPGESSTDLVFPGHSIIAENGYILAETERFRFDTQIAYLDIDLERLNSERLKNNTFAHVFPDKEYRKFEFNLPELKDVNLHRKVPPSPFIPDARSIRADTCMEIFSIQTTGLAKRLMHIGSPAVVLGISGGLDSTLALLVCAKAMDKLDKDCSNIHAISLPGLGTSKRTKNNARKLAEILKTDYRSISIIDAVNKHFADIRHDPTEKNIVYENAQARERMQILMDIANQVDGLVVGTGDLSELALGWSTYNGDQMSMYGVNAGIPKTLVKYIIEWCAEEEYTGEASSTLRDIINTPISPELLPTDEQGKITQLTEASIGPYELHDFFLFYMFRFNFSPKKILFLAKTAFKDTYSEKDILHYLKVFYSRFFNNQFKRSCMPDGMRVGTVSLSPRGDWRMPSDACVAIWLDEIDTLQN